MSRYLLLPADERELVAYMCGELGLVLLMSDLTNGGVPRIASDPMAALHSTLPEPPRVGYKYGTYLFWCSSAGPVQTLRDQPWPADPKRRVGRFLTEEALGDLAADAIDYANTPMIRFRRSYWHTEDLRRLVPAALHAMDLIWKETPSDVRRLHGRVERWLKKRAERLNSFEYVSHIPFPLRQPLRPRPVWVQPNALSWVRAGGEIWPWDA